MLGWAGSVYRKVESNTSGTPFVAWERIGDVAKISPQYLEVVVFLYPSIEAARDATNIGGSGFLVGIPYATVEGPLHIYAVTNRHVVLNGAQTIRTLGRDRTVMALSLDWTLHPDGDDIAVALVPPIIPLQRVVSLPDFVTPDLLRSQSFGPGDDVFMVGRFVGLDKRVHNTPTARFGNVAMLETERVHDDPTGFDQESFLVEMRSLPGYSGSPVFITVSGLQFIDPAAGLPGRKSGTWLLGIDWSHIRRFEKVLQPKGTDDFEPVPEGWVVQENSGMAGVVPAWKIAELLQEEGIVKQRQNVETARRDLQAVKGGASADTSEPAFTKAEFDAALRRVSRRKPSPPAEGTSGT